ncbi:MAG: hypothetical protein ACFE92_17790 [Promethearchaeota archaeon]
MDIFIGILIFVWFRYLILSTSHFFWKYYATFFEFYDTFIKKLCFKYLESSYYKKMTIRILLFPEFICFNPCSCGYYKHTGKLPLGNIITIEQSSNRYEYNNWIMY